MEPFSLIGWAGTMLILLAYILNASGRVTSAHRAYHLLNLFGALALGVNVFHQAAWPALVLQCVWGAIALWSLVKKRGK